MPLYFNGTRYPLIGLTGYKGVGKDTVAAHLVKMYNFERMGYADKLKEAVAALFGIDVEKVDLWKSPTRDGLPRAEVRLGFLSNRDWTEYAFEWREFLQRFGTEMGRNVFGQDFWVNLLMSRPFYKPTVITDVRFKNEALAVKENAGKIVMITRPGHEPDGHASEVGLPHGLVDYTIDNDHDKIELFLKVEKMMMELYNIELQGVDQ